MNTIHDMGGMDGFGPIEPEENEPVFHQRWEGRVYALMRAVGPWGRGREWPSFRFTLETIPPVEYLSLSYYERWFRMMTTRLLVSGLISETELETGYSDPGTPRPEMLPGSNSGSLGAGLLDRDVPARFGPNDRVRARNLHPRGHTRQPRYVRGRAGDGGRGSRRVRAAGHRRGGAASPATAARSTSIRFASKPGNYGASRLPRATPCTSTCGKTTWSRRDGRRRAGRRQTRSTPSASRHSLPCPRTTRARCSRRRGRRRPSPSP